MAAKLVNMDKTLASPIALPTHGVSLSQGAARWRTGRISAARAAIKSSVSAVLLGSIAGECLSHRVGRLMQVYVHSDYAVADSAGAPFPAAFGLRWCRHGLALAGWARV
jgi:hypothetical protein